MAYDIQRLRWLDLLVRDGKVGALELTRAAVKSVPEYQARPGARRETAKHAARS